jgi:hypothetical protein
MFQELEMLDLGLHQDLVEDLKDQPEEDQELEEEEDQQEEDDLLRLNNHPS